METIEWVTLISNNPWMSKECCLWSYLILVRTFEVKEMVLIHTEKGLEHRRGPVFYSWVKTDEVRIQDITLCKNFWIYIV